MKNVIITAILIFIVNFIMQISLDYFLTKENGQIISSASVKVDSLHYSQTLLVSNYQKKSIENLEFSTTKGSIADIVSNGSIITKKISEKKFLIEKLYPFSNITIRVDLLKPSANSEDEPDVQPLNFSENDLVFQKVNDFKQKIKIDWLNILINCLVISIIFGFFFYFFDRESNKLYVSIAETKKDAQELSNELDKNRKQNFKKIDNAEKNIRTFKESYTKLKILLLKKTRDLQKENDYYKTLLKSIITKNQNKINQEDIEDLVRDHLKTFSTKGKIDSSLDEIDVIANIIENKHER